LTFERVKGFHQSSVADVAIGYGRMIAGGIGITHLAFQQIAGEVDADDKGGAIRQGSGAPG